jgi:sugar/nucleoside kinase (ribokinase family)
MTGGRLDILGIGVVAVDDIIHVGRYPAADEKQPILREERVFGGLVGTALAAAAALGGHCGYLGVLGGDDLSRAMLEGLANAGVDVGLVSFNAAARPVHSVIIADDTYHTRNIFFNEIDVTAPPLAAITSELIGQGGVLLVDHVHVAAAAHACRVARQLGIPSVADVESHNGAAIEGLLGAVDHLIISKNCAKALTGAAAPQDMVSRLSRAHHRLCTAVTCGPEGCFYAQGDAPVQHQKAYKVQTKDTTGCGDVFHGAYALALSQGADVRGCIQAASAAAAVFAARPSGWENLPRQADIASMIAAGID